MDEQQGLGEILERNAAELWAAREQAMQDRAVEELVARRRAEFARLVAVTPAHGDGNCDCCGAYGEEHGGLEERGSRDHEHYGWRGHGHRWDDE